MPVSPALRVLLLAAAAGVPALAVADDPPPEEKVKQMLGYGCSHLNEPLGTGTLELDGQAEETNAIAMVRGGQLIVSVGKAGESGPARCVTLYSAGPVTPGSYEVVDGPTAVETQPGADQPVFLGVYTVLGYASPFQVGTGGTVTISAIEPQVQGSFAFETPGGPAEGTFEAEEPG